MHAFRVWQGESLTEGDAVLFVILMQPLSSHYGNPGACVGMNIMHACMHAGCG